jgi:transcriptional regulator with XRE-family HTH domain
VAGRVAMSDGLIRISGDCARALRAEIEARGLTQLDVDHRAGLGEGHTSKILNRKKNPTVETLVSILDVLDLDLAFAAREAEPPR